MVLKQVTQVENRIGYIVKIWMELTERGCFLNSFGKRESLTLKKADTFGIQLKN